MSNPRVLVVDDDPRNIKLLATLLQEAGYEVLRASDGQAACTAVCDEGPDLVVLDAMMPGMNGFEVCTWIRGRESTALLPIIMVTALNAMEEKVHALETGADDFLSKPINRLELLAKVKSLLRVKALQDDLEKKNEDLRRAESLRDSLVQMIVHDLKNPLAGIQGYIELMESCLEEDSRERRLARSIKRTCGNMVNMILDMLDVGRIEEGCDIIDPETLDLSAILAENLEECSGQAISCEVTLVNETESPAPLARADAGLIRRVIGNLLNNALKHTPPGGRVTAGVHGVGNRVEIRVTDSGEGIPQDQLERIFEKFSRAQGQTRGTRRDRGLGLTFCKLAVEAHGGCIKAESERGRGSRFTVILPASSGVGDTVIMGRSACA